MITLTALFELAKTDLHQLRLRHSVISSDTNVTDLKEVSPRSTQVRFIGRKGGFNKEASSKT